MLGPPKPRLLGEPTVVSLEALMPLRNVYRHLEAKRCLGFIRRWTRELHAERGRPSISPVVHAASSSLVHVSRHLRGSMQGSEWDLLIAAGRNPKRFLAVKGRGRRYAQCGSRVARPRHLQEV
jgi:hypothetical protein